MISFCYEEPAEVCASLCESVGVSSTGGQQEVTELERLVCMGQKEKEEPEERINEGFYVPLSHASVTNTLPSDDQHVLKFQCV
ncbi:hypothetical protein CHARACLAT_017040 [Characodon lateralis]|uniref:Uncharacterized protein n=1 Tax=Characodon lateralis TaxID=208331 RepID=A0ABU7EMH1_9TELE|nr:hypothetical protein [Characodon lateralis]